MLIAVLILAALALGEGAAALTLALLVWGGERRKGSVPTPAEEKEKPFPLDDAKMQEGIAILLGFQPGRGEGDS